MAHHTLITVSGFVATSPKLVVRDAGAAFCTFRLASTPRRFDRSAGSWVDDRTEWFTVKAFRDAAENIGQSVHKGDPLVVHGRFQTSEWTGEDGTPRTSREIVATSIGHDLSFGVSHFVRAVRGRVSAGDDESVGAGADVRDGVGSDDRGVLDDTGVLLGDRDDVVDAVPAAL